MPTVLLGNPAALEHGNPIGEQVTVHVIPEGDTHDERMRTLTHRREGVWIAIADEHPSWVASDDNDLATAIAEHYGCPVVDIHEGRDRFLEKHPHPVALSHIAHVTADGAE